MSKRPGGGIFAKKQIANANQNVKFNTNSLKLYKSPRMNSTNQMAMRTGGWADPSRMTAERKFVDVAATIATTDGGLTFGNPVLLNGISTGTDASTRIGRKVNLSSILIRYTAYLGGDSTFGSPVRIMVFYDKQANATAVTTAASFPLVSNTFTSPNELSYRDRFVTIFDHITEPLSVNANASVAGTLYKKLQLEMIFNTGADATIGSISTGAIYVMAAQNGVVGTNGPDVRFFSKIQHKVVEREYFFAFFV